MLRLGGGNGAGAPRTRGGSIARARMRRHPLEMIKSGCGDHRHDYQRLGEKLSDGEAASGRARASASLGYRSQKGAPGVQRLSGCPSRPQAGEKGLNSTGGSGGYGGIRQQPTATFVFFVVYS